MSSTHTHTSLPGLVGTVRFAIPLRLVQPITAAVDAAAIAAAGILCHFVYSDLIHAPSLTGEQIVGLTAATALLAVPASHVSARSTPDTLIYGKLQMQRLLLCIVFTALFISGLIASVDVKQAVPWRQILLFFLLAAPALVAARYTARRLMRRALFAGAIRGPRIALISSCRVGMDDMAGEFDRFGYSVVRKMDLPRDASMDEIEDVAQKAVAAVRGSAIEEVLIAVDCVSVKNARPLLERLRSTPLPVRLVLNTKTTELFTHNPLRVGGMCTFEIQRPPLGSVELAAKRVLDLLVAGSCLLVLSPVLLLACVAIKLESKGPVFFSQTRHGFNGRSFSILKFRSMAVMENGDTIIQARKNDARVTRVGRFLRRTSIDELPQLLNVLRGEMSLVGPRPHAVAHDNYYSSELTTYAFRQHVAPGITGWAQVHGFRGETRTVQDMERRVQHDVWYIDHWSLWLDLQILMRTALEVVRARNAY